MDTADIPPIATLELDYIERWNVFRRLNELSIPCQCAYGKPLRVNIETAATAIQVWSVTQQCLLPRSHLVARLERCWREKVGHGKGE
jgi:hypothetical protein